MLKADKDIIYEAHIFSSNNLRHLSFWVAIIVLAAVSGCGTKQDEKIDERNLTYIYPAGTDCPRVRTIHDAEFDARGNLWIADWGSICAQEGEEWTTISFPFSDPVLGWVNGLAFDSVGDTWIALNEYGLGIPTGDGWLYSSPTDAEFFDAQSIEIDNEGGIWITHSLEPESLIAGISFFDGETWTTFGPTDWNLPSAYVTAIDFDSENNVWIGTGFTGEGGVAKFNGDHWQSWTTNNSELSNGSVQTLAVDEKNNLWVGTRDGLYKYDGEVWTHFSTGNSGIFGNYVDVISFDKNGDVWIISRNLSLDDNDREVQIFDGQSWRTITTGYEDETGFANKIIFDPKGCPWVVTGKHVIGIPEECAEK